MPLARLVSSLRVPRIDCGPRTGNSSQLLVVGHQATRPMEKGIQGDPVPELWALWSQQPCKLPDFDIVDGRGCGCPTHDLQPCSPGPARPAESRLFSLWAQAACSALLVASSLGSQQAFCEVSEQRHKQRNVNIVFAFSRSTGETDGSNNVFVAIVLESKGTAQYSFVVSLL